MPRPVVIVPIRSFTGMTRLTTVLDASQRSDLSRRLGAGVVAAATDAGLAVVVVTSDDEVTQWADDLDLGTCDDPGTGLSGAANAGIARAGDTPWLVVHADLPLATSHALAHAARASETSTVLVPSHDGGTTVIGGHGSFPFSYGIGSFRRHLALAPSATVIVSAALSIDIDAPRHLASFPWLA